MFTVTDFFYNAWFSYGLSLKYTSVETEINKKNVTHEEETKFPPGTCTRKNSTRKTADISRRHQTYVIIPRFRK